MDDPTSSEQLFLHIPVTAKELALVTALATEDGLPVIDYVRSCILPGPIDPVEVVARRLTHSTRRP